MCRGAQQARGLPPARRRDIEALESFRSVEDRWTKRTFFKCHRSYQVNLRNIDHFDRTDIVMRSGACIPLSRSCKQGFQDAYFAVRFEGGRH
ncbi:MAG: LytTR family DNA-binding domain-containing protein [Collinsella sp.]